MSVRSQSLKLPTIARMERRSFQQGGYHISNSYTDGGVSSSNGGIVLARRTFVLQVSNICRDTTVQVAAWPMFSCRVANVLVYTVEWP
eukprot:2130675-Pyramimonas_sp.AAC.1